MPGTVDDFMQRFGGGGTMDESDAAQYHDRFVSTHPNDRDFDSNTYQQAATQYLGKLPDDKFREAARNAVTQVPPQERAGLLGTLMGALSGAGSAGGGGGAAAPCALTNCGTPSNTITTLTRPITRNTRSRMSAPSTAGEPSL
jgi:hypothetical protein